MAAFVTRVAVTAVGLFSAALGVYTVVERFVYGSELLFYVPTILLGTLATVGSLVGIWVIWTEGGI